MLKRLENYVGDLVLDEEHLLFYSPDFSQNLTLDKKKKTFSIVDTITNAFICEIPVELMSP